MDRVRRRRRRGVGEQRDKRPDVRLGRPRHGVPLVDEAQKQALPELPPPGRLERQQADGRGAEDDAVYAPEAAREQCQLALDAAEHVAVQEGRDGAAGRVARQEERVPCPPGVLLQQLP